MGFIKNLKTAWKNMTPKQKVQLAICGICDIGADLLAGMALGKLVPENEKKWKKMLVIFTAGGLGMWAGETAAEQINSTIDVMWKDKDEDEEEDDDE